MQKFPLSLVMLIAAVAGMVALDWHFGVFAVSPFGKGPASGLQLMLMIGTIIYPLLLSGLVGAVADKLLRQRAATWPQVQGKIAAFDTGVTLGRSAHHWTECAYDYVVDGQKYSGRIYTIFKGGLLNQGDDADAYQASHPVGGALPIRYNPARPSISLVLEQAPRSGWDVFWLLFMFLIPLAMLVPEIRDSLWR